MAEEQKQEEQQIQTSVEFKDDTIGMVYDKRNGQAQVFSKTQNPDGSHALTSPDTNPESFLILRGSVPEVFLKNLVKNHRDPRFDVLLFPRNMLDTIKRSLGNYMKNTKSDAVKLLYNCKMMPSGKFKYSVKGNYITEDQIPWDDLTKYGVFYGNLDYDPRRQQYGHLDKMCRMGDPSAGLVNIHYNEGVANIIDNMKLRFSRENGKVRVKMAGVLQKPQYEYKGVRFSEEGNESLDATGNLGYVLNTPEGSYLVSRDPETKRLSCQNIQDVYMQSKINGREITDDERQQLKEGKKVHLDGMTNAKGEKFEADYQYSAVYRRLIQVLTPEQRLALARDFAHEREMKKATEAPQKETQGQSKEPTTTEKPRPELKPRVTENKKTKSQRL